MKYFEETEDGRLVEIVDEDVKRELDTGIARLSFTLADFDKPQGVES